MSLLTNQSEVNPNKAFWAPASGGGGGGGSNFNNINVSSINFTGNPGYISYTGSMAIDGLNSGTQDFTFASPATYQPVYPAGLPSTTACQFKMNAPDNQAYVQTSIGTDQAVFIDAVGAGGAAGIYINAGGVATTAIGCSTLTVSSINGLAPGGGGSVPMDLAVSTLTVNDEPTAQGAYLQMRANDVNLYGISCVSSSVGLAEIQLGYVGGRNQFYTGVGEIDQCFTSSITAVGGGPVSVTSAANFNNILNAGVSPVNISSLTVSSINGAAPGGFSPVNQYVPFITGSSSPPLWTLTVPQNTAGSPIPLTSTLITTPANTYLVSFSLVNGTNNDLTSITRLKLYTAGTDLPVRAYPGDAADFTAGGMASAVSVLVSGASALRLQAENSSTTTPTVLNFDNLNSVRITNLGP